MNANLKQWDSKAEMMEHILKSANNIVIGSNTEAPKSYFSYSISGPLDFTEIGLISNQNKKPEVLMDAACAMFGYDNFVVIVDKKVKVVTNRIRLDSLFFEFLKDEERQQVLVMHELGVIALSYDGIENWRYSSDDIIESWEKRGGRLILKIWDDDLPHELNLDRLS